ncbi:cysteine protease [Actinomyces israelii]|uniref:cysteine protease n=2 Tax=Actinomyces israelii TaxID=1659 RepID=UPI0025534A92|nr:cysteine protease [Actinomyces israelii]WKR20322.1 hypothetical protein AIF0345_0193 [Actinomyces israelii]
MTGGDALAGVVVGAVPGCPGGVRALADSWRLTGRALVEGADLAAGARAATASWQGAAARAFTAAATALTGDLDDGAERLEAGARALEGYARVLDRAVVAADQLRAALAPVLAAAQAAPATAPVAVAVIARTAGAWTNILAEVRLAALRTATTLQAAADDNNPQAGGGASGPPAPLPTTPLDANDIARIRKEADGHRAWSPQASQGRLGGNCYLLAALQAYSQTPEGQQHLRDHVRWDEDKQAFVVTLYDHGRPVDVEVRDTYTNGSRGQTSMIDIYERAYSIHYGAGPLGADWPSGVMQNITGGDAHTLSTWGGSGWFRWPRKEDHQYTDAQWDEIQQAVQDGRPVVGLTGRGDFSHGDAVTATTDTNRSGTVGDGPDQTPIKETDQEGTYRIVGSDYDHDPTTPESGHQYTIVAVDDEGVTLRNPWGHNDNADPNLPRADNDGLIRISRADYEKYFSHTTIGEAP